MANARTFASLVLAQQAAGYLLNNGIPATIVGGLDALAGSSMYAAGGGRYTVVVEDAHEAAAKATLTHMDQTPARPEPGWEAQARPDLSKLEPGTQAPCPSCSAPLPLEASLTVCPSCDAPADVVEVLVARYGPESLEACYTDAQEDIPEDVLDASLINCLSCGYPLSGLDHTGLCPECGAAYSKQEILRRRTGLM